ncbi:alpha/beta hydrolase, partial [Streptomyces sp. SID10244]|nr:alpha/beta hydrolase [Streptomyces sp. SID10244]
MDDSERIGWMAGVTGVAALGAVAAGGVARNVARRRTANRTDPFAGVDFTTIYDDTASTVTTDDGIDLAVRTVITGPAGADPDEIDPELTVIFIHGFSLRMASWHFQR